MATIIREWRRPSQSEVKKYFVTQYLGFLYDWSGFSQYPAFFHIRFQFQPPRQKHNVSATSASARRNSNDPSLRGKYQQEKYPPSKKEKRILKQRSQDSLSSSLIRAHASSPGGRSAQPLPSPPETPRTLEKPPRPSRPSRPQSTTETGTEDSVKVEINRSEVPVCNDDREDRETMALVEESDKNSEVTSVHSSLEHSENRESQYQVLRNW